MNNWGTIHKGTMCVGMAELQSQVEVVELAELSSERTIPQNHQCNRKELKPWECLSDRIQTSHWRSTATASPCRACLWRTAVNTIWGTHTLIALLFSVLTMVLHQQVQSEYMELIRFMVSMCLEIKIREFIWMTHINAEQGKNKKDPKHYVAKKYSEFFVYEGFLSAVEYIFLCSLDIWSHVCTHVWRHIHVKTHWCACIFYDFKNLLSFLVWFFWFMFNS